jgi:hypothetical protein
VAVDSRDDHLFDFSQFWEVLFFGELLDVAHDGDLFLEAVDFAVVFGDVSDDVLEFHVLQVFLVFHQFRCLVLRLELFEVWLHSALGFGDVQVFVFLEDGVFVVEGDGLALAQGDVFLGEVDLEEIGDHGEVVVVPHQGTDQVDCAFNE